MTTQVEVRRPNNRTLAVIDGGLNAAACVQPMATALKPKLLDRVRQMIRTRHYSVRTEKAYAHWIKRFIIFHDKRHPNEMGRIGNRTISFEFGEGQARKRLHAESSAQCGFISL